MSDFDACREKMEGAGVGEAAILAFARSYEKLVSRESGFIAESEIDPATDLPTAGGEAGATFDAGELAQAVVIKLNGGLGTGMGLQKAKSLLEVREGLTFLDIIVRQIQKLRAQTGAQVRFLLMNSFSTSADSLAHLARYAADGLAGADEVELMQNQVPKIDRETLRPVSWPASPEQEWCPPGHGDLYPALVGSGWLDRLLADGVKYAFVSNSDNLGAVLDGGMLSFFARSGAPFLMEVTRRTEGDKKGGHLARRKSDGRLILREVAQCPEEDLDSFQAIDTHRYFNTNNLWVRLDKLKEALEAEGGVLPLPMICNSKTVDPRDKKSTPVYQLETAMGAAIECFEGAQAVEVPRSRFVPVKSTADLVALRSDAYLLQDDGQVVLDPSRAGVPPVVTLGGEYKLVDAITDLGVPSLLHAKSLAVSGPVRFGPQAVVEGAVSVSNSSGEPLEVNRLLKDEDVVG